MDREKFKGQCVQEWHMDKKGFKVGFSAHRENELKRANIGIWSGNASS